MTGLDNCFIAGVSPPEKTELEKKGVEFCDYSLDDGKEGIIIEGETLARTLRILNAEVKAQKETELEGLIEIELKKTSKKSADEGHGVSIGEWNGGSHRGQFKRAAEEILLPVILTDIIIEVPHAKTREPILGTQFYIWIWSSPSGDNEDRLKLPETIFGTKVDCRDTGYKSTGQGRAIIDPETGWTVAELVGNNLYIHHDICHRGTGGELAIFHRLLGEVVFELTASPAEKKTRNRALFRGLYVRACAKHLEDDQTQNKEKIRNQRARLGKLQEEIVGLIRSIPMLEKKIQAAEDFQKGMEVKFAKEFDDLLKIPEIQEVQIINGVIAVFTDTILLTDETFAKTYKLGRFRIEIDPDGGSHGIRFFNLTRRGRTLSYGGYGFHHPHVDEEGDPCLGNIQEAASDLIGNCEFTVLVQLALQFLRSVNTDEWDEESIEENWPVFKRERGI